MHEGVHPWLGKGLGVKAFRLSLGIVRVAVGWTVKSKTSVSSV